MYYPTALLKKAIDDNINSSTRLKAVWEIRQAAQAALGNCTLSISETEQALDELEDDGRIRRNYGRYYRR